MVLFELAGSDPRRRFSSRCWRTVMALAHKDLSVERLPWRFTDKPAIAQSGQDCVPVLVDGSLWISDSWKIAEYLEITYQERPSLFGDQSGRALALFTNEWSEAILQPLIAPLITMDIYNHVAEQDSAYFRNSREKRYGMKLEEFCSDRDMKVEKFRAALEPMRRILHRQPFIGGNDPMYCDYAVFGAMQWARTISPYKILENGDPVTVWRDRVLDLFDGLGRKTPAYD